ncbi:hypothetical protein OF83DRAFT_155647 [Amylostereum chailletii]|nr:hypothetical protein OF83DRAFT_155647 [Amylostereum chailletii]
MKTMKDSHPELLYLSLFMFKCINYAGHRTSFSSPSPTLSQPASHRSASTIASLLDWERTTYYNGISPDHPALLCRSDLLENPSSSPRADTLISPPRPCTESSTRRSTPPGTPSLPRSASSWKLGRFATQPSRQPGSSVVTTARTKFTSRQLTDTFCPRSGGRTAFE